MNKFEHVVDKAIPYCLLILLGIITVEFFFTDFAHEYHDSIVIIDTMIILIFITDLLFKYRHAKNAKLFLKSHWLEIIAVIPFFLVFRIVEEVGLIRLALSETTQSMQGALHVGTAAEKEVVAVERLASRSTRFQRFLQPILRSTRFLKATEFFAHPKHRKQ